jgi:hypothetical protein
LAAFAVDTRQQNEAFAAGIFSRKDAKMPYAVLRTMKGKQFTVGEKNYRLENSFLPATFLAETKGLLW